MRLLTPALGILLLLFGAPGARAASTSAIAQEVARTTQLEKRFVSVWWLPAEYWEAAARELGWKADRVAEVRERMSLYAVIGIVDASLTPDKRFAFAETPAIADRLTLRLGGAPLSALRKLDPALMQPMPELTYLLRTSLAGLAKGLTFMFFPNVDSGGKPLIRGAESGAVQLRYAVDGRDPLVFYWHAPLTAIAGAHRDPTTGEALEASWRFNPWTGEKIQ